MDMAQKFESPSPDLMEGLGGLFLELNRSGGRRATIPCCRQEQGSTERRELDWFPGRRSRANFRFRDG